MQGMASDGKRLSKTTRCFTVQKFRC